MLNPQYWNALNILMNKLEDLDIVWALTGSMSFFLQGINIFVHDIDIQTNEDGAYIIEKHLSDFIISPIAFSSTDTIRSYLGRFHVARVSVEVMGDISKFWNDCWESPVDLFPLIRHVQYNSLSIPVLDLKYESTAYRKLGRIDKANLIDTYLKI